MSEGKREAILLLLGKLALHYWRPDFSPAQARQLYGDYVEDLMRYSLRAIEEAISKYRQSREAFYPKSGQLVQLIRTPPAWDIRSQREHDGILHREAQAEIATIAGQLQLAAPEKERAGTT